MRLALPAAALSIALASAASLAFAAETRIPDRALEQAAQLRERQVVTHLEPCTEAMGTCGHTRCRRLEGKPCR